MKIKKIILTVFIICFSFLCVVTPALASNLTPLYSTVMGRSSNGTLWQYRQKNSSTNSNLVSQGNELIALIGSSDGGMVTYNNSNSYYNFTLTGGKQYVARFNMRIVGSDSSAVNTITKIMFNVNKDSANIASVQIPNNFEPSKLKTVEVIFTAPVTVNEFYIALSVDANYYSSWRQVHFSGNLDIFNLEDYQNQYDSPRPDMQDDVDKELNDYDNAIDEALGGKSQEEIQQEVDDIANQEFDVIGSEDSVKLKNFMTLLLASFGGTYMSLLLFSCTMGLVIFILGKRSSR